jgi:hypothetical protein
MREERLEVSVTFDERRDRRRAQAQLSRIAQLDQRLPSRTMSALGGSGHAARKEEVRVRPDSDIECARLTWIKAKVQELFYYRRCCPFSQENVMKR